MEKTTISLSLCSATFHSGSVRHGASQHVGCDALLPGQSTQTHTASQDTAGNNQRWVLFPGSDDPGGIPSNFCGT